MTYTIESIKELATKVVTTTDPATGTTKIVSGLIPDQNGRMIKGARVVVGDAIVTAIPTFNADHTTTWFWSVNTICGPIASDEAFVSRLLRDPWRQQSNGVPDSIPGK